MPKINNQTRRHLFWSYLKDQKQVLFTAALFLIVFAYISYIYYLFWEPFAYGALISCFILAVLLVWNFRSWYKKHRQLLLLKEQVIGCLPYLPEVKNFIEQDYQELVKALSHHNEKQMTDQLDQLNDGVEYYTLWAHQIKTPIAAMRLILQSEEGHNKKELLEELFRIEEYVEMVLLYMKLNGETSDYLIQKYSVDTIIKQALRRYASQFIRKKIVLEYEPTSLKVITDEKWLLFVIEQLLSNSLKYTPKQGTIRIRMDEEQVLSIKDNGIGIPPEDLPRVFEKGFTGFHGREEKKATGIGLYLCKRICEKLGHTITIDSQAGKGTTAQVDLASHQLTVE